MYKKLVYAFIIFICLISVKVNAKEASLYFTESNNIVYYYIDETDETFMNRVDMLPGNDYYDYLSMYNNTSKTYTLYLKVVPREASEEVEEFLNSISMNITIDDDEIYDGLVTGEEYDGVDLQNAIKIGEFSNGTTMDLTVKTTLDKEYSNKNAFDDAYVDWLFYAEYEDEVVEIKPVNTRVQLYENAVKLLYVLIPFTLVVFGIYIYRRKKVKE